MAGLAAITQTYTNMSKAIRWQVPFASISGTKYRVDIYDEQDGTWSGITQLTAGDTPFTTDEDNSDDFFCPVRTQTGTLQICTLLPNTTDQYITLDELLPNNNIARPIKLWKLLGGGAVGILEWQGFLSCEAYSQDYTGVPQTLSLSVNGLLETMASVYLDPSLATGIQQIRVQLYYALTELDRQCGMDTPFFNYIYYSQTAWLIWMKMIDATILYDIKEYTNEESYTYVVSGISCKDVLERVCKYMGWTVRENKSSIYFCRVNETGNMFKQTLADFFGNSQSFIQNREDVALTTVDLSDSTWMGTGHQRTLMQGAKSVEVVANLAEYELEIGLPEFPTESLVHTDEGVIEAYVTFDNDFNNKLTMSYYQLTVRETSGGYDIFISGFADVQDAFNDCILSPNCDIAAQYPRKITNTSYLCVKNIGAFFGRFNFSGQGETSWVDGLYIVAVNEMYAATDRAPVVFKMDSIISFRLIDGTLKFKANGVTIGDDGTELVPFLGQVEMKMRFGNLYWNGSAWQATDTFFTADFSTQQEEDQEPGEYILNIPITTPLQGTVSIEVRGGIRGGASFAQYYQPFYDLFLSELSLEHEEPEYITESEHKNNHYYRVLNTHFRDEISISTELASTLNNRPSPSLIMDDTNTPMRFLSYDNVPRRPEVDLLNRLAAYYGAARQRLELIVAHPTSAPLPLLRLNGISPDTRKYLPLAESRDWQEETSTITCFETPNNE